MCIFCFRFRNYNWFWVPLLGPHIGAILGAFIYLVLIESHWDQDDGPKYQVQESGSNNNKGGVDNDGLGERGSIELAESTSASA